MRSVVSKSQLKPAEDQGVDSASPDPRPITESATVAHPSIGHSPQPSSSSTDDSYDHEKNKRWELSEQETTPTKRRGGKRSRRASRFTDDDGEDGEDDYDRLQEKRRQKEMRKAQREAERTEPIPIILPELINVMAFANALKIKPDEFLVQLGELGFEGVTLDSLMAGETAALVAQEYGYEPTVDAGGGQDLKPRPPPQDPSVLPSRPPVVTIMGHVDHGKTTILDYLRQSSVVAQEHGGITQHIGAFSVKLSSGKPITFLDTPGHAAFLTMRQRGANVTDIVVLVVAADDSVKPQTLEALKHARAAKVPIIVAINKIDKDGARIDAVKADLATAGIEIEDYGGDVQVVCVSGKTGQGMDDLEENILTLSEILDHRSEIDGPAEGWVLESSLKPTGKVATVLVKRGTLRPGDYIAAGLTWAKIRQLRNEAGVDIAEAPPGTPVEILGWKDLPAAGDQVIQSPDEDKAKTAVSYREGLHEREKDAAEYETIAEARRTLQAKRAREKAASEGTAGGASGTGVHESLPDEENGTKMVNFVVKGDVHGSVEAVCAAIQEIGSNEVRPRVLRSATGPISEFDVEHAATSKSVLVNFATTTPGHIRRLAESQGVRILDHTVIYPLVDDVRANLSEYLTPDISTRVLGEAEVLQIFPINLRGRVYKNIAGCRVRNGVVGKNSVYRVLRRGEVIYDGKLETLKHVKKDVMEMRKGTECGMGFEEFQDLEVGDEIQAYEEVRTARSL
ncbi:hypothetical protein F4803DRAFT_508989 [Xylaria telfairii]|nr:hypothetical protein F4803DRAFT_508989 [Xylaria telfairii]